MTDLQRCDRERAYPHAVIVRRIDTPPALTDAIQAVVEHADLG